MTTIVGYADLLRLKKCDEETTKMALNYIYSETKRLESLSFKLMKLMSLSSENIELTTIEIGEFLPKLACKLNKVFDNEIVIDVKNAKIRGDKELLEVVVRNLVENSNKAEPKDNKIFIKGEILNDEKYRISVIDSGVGIPKEHLNRVTEDFYMIDKSRSRENNGSGIGLSLVKKILSLHDSKFNIESKVDVGTTVYFDLNLTHN